MLAAILASGASAMPSSGTTQSLPGRRELVGTPYAATRLQGQNRMLTDEQCEFSTAWRRSEQQRHGSSIVQQM